MLSYQDFNQKGKVSEGTPHCVGTAVHSPVSVLETLDTVSSSPNEEKEKLRNLTTTQELTSTLLLNGSD